MRRNILGLLVLAAATEAAEPGLVAHWSFDEGEGTVAKDLSGGGRDAAISGPVYVRSPRGHALRFDGEDDSVTYAKHPDMLIEGDLTLLVWVRTDSSVKAKTNRLIFGDSGAGVNRNLNLRLGPYGHLRFEWGDDTSNANLLGDAKLLNGTWKHVAVVCDSGAMQAGMYVDGHRAVRMSMPLPISRATYGERVSGRFFDGCFRGEIDDIKVYSRALTEEEIVDAYRSQAVLEVSKARVSLVVRGTELDAEAQSDVTNWTDTARSVRITVPGRPEQAVEIAPKQSAPVALGTIPIERLFAGRDDLYVVAGADEPRQVKVSATIDGVMDEQVASLAVNPLLEAVRVEVDDPWTRDALPQKTARVRLTVHLGLDQAARSGGALEVTLTARYRNDVQRAQRLASPSAVKRVEFSAAGLDWGAYDVRASFRDAAGRELATAAAVATVLPGGDQRIVVLNNLVSELMNAKERGLLKRPELVFMNPRRGWCFFSVEGEASLRLADEAETLATATDGAPAEAMRLLPAGRHSIRVTGAPAQIIVRAIPALVHNVYPTTPQIRPFGSHTWERMAKYTLPNCNMIESHKFGTPECNEWLGQGRHWIMNRTAAWLQARRHGGSFEDADAIHEYWRKTPGFGGDRISGVQVDEYGASWGSAKLLLTARSAAMLAEDPDFAGKSWIPFVAGSFDSDVGRMFIKTTMAAGWPFSIERYIGEMPTEAQDREHVRAELLAEAERWESTVPGCLHHAIFTLMYAYLPYCTTNRSPRVDFRAHLEMQMQVLATTPEYFGLWGVQPYRANYVDEEILHWMGMLLRHYAIEGRTDWLLQDPYALTHISNPDFADGLDGWRVEPAGQGTVFAGEFGSYGTLEGRYPWGSFGNTFLVTKRSDKAPNRVNQTVRGLEPGRVYSLKLITGDYDDLRAGTSRQQAHVLAISIVGADVLDDAFQYPFHSARGPKPFTREHPFHMNYHWRRFRAKGATAELTISDWTSTSEPNGPIGQQLMTNFIEVQPYLEWE